MVNLRSKSKGKTVAPRAPLQKKPTIPTSPTTSDNLNLSEASLRGLSRAELQKLAKAHKVKANMKSELIIRQLSSLQIPKTTRSIEDDVEEGPSRKRFKSEAASKEVSIPPAPKNQAASPDTHPTTDTPAQPNVKDLQSPKEGPSAPRFTTPVHKVPTVLSYDEDLFSNTESEMTEEEQPDFATPVSSRSGTPPAANVIDLERCVTIMQEISAQDETLLKEATGVRETAAKLRKRARDVRELVKAERGRRERMEAYLRYWQETEPTWDREWLYGEKVEARNVNGERPGTPIPMRKPALSPEELKQKREAIVSKQEAEQRQLEALRRREYGESSRG